MSKLTADQVQKSQTERLGDKLTPDQQIESRRLEQKSKFKKIVLFSGAALLVLLMFVVFSQHSSYSPTQESSLQVVRSTQQFSKEQIDSYRQEFKQALTRYEVDIQPDITKIRLSQWETARVSELNLIKEKALSSFAQGAFLQANQHYDDLLQKSNALIQEYNEQTLEYVNLAKEAFEQDDIALAQINVDNALNLMPTNPQAIELQTRINAYSEVSALLSELRVAKIENNLPKQIDILTDIVDLDPSRNDLSDDLDKVQSDYARQQLESTLKKAENSINQGNLVQAQSILDTAKEIDPDSKGLLRLQTQLNKQKTASRLDQIFTQLRKYSSDDNWKGAETLAKKSLETYPDNSELFDYFQQATQVQSASSRLNQFILRPERLADESIRDAAKSAITKAFGPSLLSPSLAGQIQTLSEQIDNYELDVPLTITSDGDTYIVVLGVGHVGQYTEKTISLKPGRYTLEGRREGYRSKRKDILVKANLPLTVQLICDEPIVN